MSGLDFASSVQAVALGFGGGSLLTLTVLLIVFGWPRSVRKGDRDVSGH